MQKSTKKQKLRLYKLENRVKWKQTNPSKYISFMTWPILWHGEWSDGIKCWFRCIYLKNKLWVSPFLHKYVHIFHLHLLGVVLELTTKLANGYDI
jgi:hypothetical protein